MLPVSPELFGGAWPAFQAMVGRVQGNPSVLFSAANRADVALQQFQTFHRSLEETMLWVRGSGLKEGASAQAYQAVTTQQIEAGIALEPPMAYAAKGLRVAAQTVLYAKQNADTIYNQWNAIAYQISQNYRAQYPYNAQYYVNQANILNKQVEQQLKQNLTLFDKNMSIAMECFTTELPYPIDQREPLTKSELALQVFAAIVGIGDVAFLLMISGVAEVAGLVGLGMGVYMLGSWTIDKLMNYGTDFGAAAKEDLAWWGGVGENIKPLIGIDDDDFTSVGEHWQKYGGQVWDKFAETYAGPLIGGINSGDPRKALLGGAQFAYGVYDLKDTGEDVAGIVGSIATSATGSTAEKGLESGVPDVAEINVPQVQQPTIEDLVAPDTYHGSLDENSPDDPSEVNAAGGGALSQGVDQSAADKNSGSTHAKAAGAESSQGDSSQGKADLWLDEGEEGGRSPDQPGMEPETASQEDNNNRPGDGLGDESAGLTKVPGSVESASTEAESASAESASQTDEPTELTTESSAHDVPETTSSEARQAPTVNNNTAPPSTATEQAPGREGDSQDNAEASSTDESATRSSDELSSDTPQSATHSTESPSTTSDQNTDSRNSDTTTPTPQSESPRTTTDLSTTETNQTETTPTPTSAEPAPSNTNQASPPTHTDTPSNTTPQQTPAETTTPTTDSPTPTTQQDGGATSGNESDSPHNTETSDTPQSATHSTESPSTTSDQNTDSPTPTTTTDQANNGAPTVTDPTPQSETTTTPQAETTTAPPAADAAQTDNTTSQQPTTESTPTPASESPTTTETNQTETTPTPTSAEPAPSNTSEASPPTHTDTPSNTTPQQTPTETTTPTTTADSPTPTTATTDSGLDEAIGGARSPAEQPESATNAMAQDAATQDSAAQPGLANDGSSTQPAAASVEADSEPAAVPTNVPSELTEHTDPAGFGPRLQEFSDRVLPVVAESADPATPMLVIPTSPGTGPMAFVTDSSGAVQGVATARLGETGAQTTAKVNQMVVSPQMRGGQVERQLIDLVKRHLGSLGAASIEWSADATSNISDKGKLALVGGGSSVPNGSSSLPRSGRGGDSSHESGSHGDSDTGTDPFAGGPLNLVVPAEGGPLPAGVGGYAALDIASMEDLASRLSGTGLNPAQVLAANAPHIATRGAAATGGASGRSRASNADDQAGSQGSKQNVRPSDPQTEVDPTDLDENQVSASVERVEIAGDFPRLTQLQIARMLANRGYHRGEYGFNEPSGAISLDDIAVSLESIRETTSDDSPPIDSSRTPLKTLSNPDSTHGSPESESDDSSNESRADLPPDVYRSSLDDPAQSDPTSGMSPGDPASFARNKRTLRGGDLDPVALLERWSTIDLNDTDSSLSTHLLSLVSLAVHARANEALATGRDQDGSLYLVSGDRWLADGDGTIGPGTLESLSSHEAPPIFAYLGDIELSFVALDAEVSSAGSSESRATPAS
jgi:hypothetical protein